MPVNMIFLSLAEEYAPEIALLPSSSSGPPSLTAEPGDDSLLSATESEIVALGLQFCR